MAMRALDLPLIMNALNGVPQLLGTIVATTTKNNHDTAAPFNDTAPALTGKTLMLQPDTECYVYFGALNTQTATTSHVHLDPFEKIVIRMNDTLGYVACVAVSGTTNLRVHEMA